MSTDSECGNCLAFQSPVTPLSRSEAQPTSLMTFEAVFPKQTFVRGELFSMCLEFDGAHQLVRKPL